MADNYTPSTDEVQAAIREADEYMADHRVTESWRVISRLHATLVRLIDGLAARDESVRADHEKAVRERIARNIVRELGEGRAADLAREGA